MALSWVSGGARKDYENGDNLLHAGIPCRRPDDRACALSMTRWNARENFLRHRRSHYLGRNRFAGCGPSSCGHRQPKEVVMANVPMSLPLRLTLRAYAGASGATAALLVAGAGLLERLLGLPVALMREAGMLLIPYVVLVVFVAARPSVAVNAIIAINAAWTAASVLLLVSGWVSPTLLGVAFVLAQALAVGAFAAIQYLCLRQAGSGVPA